MSRYIPEGSVDPNTFQSIMESANAKYLLAKVIILTQLDFSFWCLHNTCFAYFVAHINIWNCFYRICWLKFLYKWRNTWQKETLRPIFQTFLWQCNFKTWISESNLFSLLLRRLPTLLLYKNNEFILTKPLKSRRPIYVIQRLLSWMLN